MDLLRLPEESLIGGNLGTGGVGRGPVGGADGGNPRWGILRRLRTLLGGTSNCSALRTDEKNVAGGGGGGGGARDGGDNDESKPSAGGDGIVESEPFNTAGDDGNGEVWICMLTGRRKVIGGADRFLLLELGKAGRAEVGGGCGEGVLGDWLLIGDIPREYSREEKRRGTGLSADGTSADLGFLCDISSNDDASEDLGTCICTSSTATVFSALEPSYCSLTMDGDADLRVGLLVPEEFVDRGGVLYAPEYRLLKLGTLKLGVPLEDAEIKGYRVADNERELGPGTCVDVAIVFDCSWLEPKSSR